MQLPSFGMPQAQNPYAIPQPGPNKKSLIIMFGGAVLLILLIGWLFFGTGGKAGQTEMEAGLQSTGDAVGAITTYSESITSTAARNRLALIRVLLNGNYQTLNELYESEYNGKQKFDSAPEPDSSTAETLDKAISNNVLDSKIMEVLREKVAAAYKNFEVVGNKLSKQESKDTIDSALADLEAVDEELAKPL